MTLFDPVDTWKRTYLEADTYTVKELIIPIFINGKCVYQSPSVMDIQAYCKEELETLWPETRRLINPHRVHIDLSDKLYQLKNRLLDEMTKKK